MQKFILVISPKEHGHPAQEVPLTSDVVSIGRSAANLLKILDTGASRKHCLIIRAGETYKIVDLKSTNGTRVNNVLIKQAILKNGDQIKIGRQTIIFKVLQT